MVNSKSHLLYVNGQFCEQDEFSLSALDRGFTLGDGVFETMRACGGKIFRLSRHLQRMKQGASLLKIPIPTDEALTGALEEVLSRSLELLVTVRVTLTRGVDNRRGIVLPRQCTPTLAIHSQPMSSPSGQLYPNGCRAIVSAIRRNNGSPLSRIKSCNYGDSILARLEAKTRNADEAILLNNKEEVACAATANVFFVKNGILYTPPEKTGALPGITRECILESAGVLGIPTELSTFDLSVLQNADEAFLSNTIIGILPLREIEGEILAIESKRGLTIHLARTLQTLIDSELR